MHGLGFSAVSLPQSPPLAGDGRSELSGRRGINPSEEPLGAALVMRLLLELPKEDGYFRPMADHTSMSDALWQTIRELRYAGVTAADLPAAAFTSGAKHAELVALVDAYERHLAASNVFDMPMLLAEAVKHREWCPIGADDAVIEVPDAMWSPLVRRFLKALHGRHAPARTLNLEDVPAPRRAGDLAALVEWCGRRPAASAADSMSSGLPASMTRPGRLLLRFCEWVGADFGAAELRRLLQSGDATSGQVLSTGQAARLLLKAKATWGRDTYPPALTRLAAEYEKQAASGEATDQERDWNTGKAAQTRMLATWIASAIDSAPRPDANDTVALDVLVECAVAFLEANASRANAMDARALIALTDELRDLKTLGAYRCSMDTGLGFMKGRVESLSVGRDRPRPGQLHVSSLADASFDARPLVFIVGLQEGGVFPTAVEDPVLLDVERNQINTLLRTSADRLNETVFAVLSRLATLGATAERLCLSFSCRDTREFRETFPSWVVLQACRLKEGNAALNYEQMTKRLKEPVSAVPGAADRASTEAGWWLANCVSQAGARAEILRAFPSLADGRGKARSVARRDAAAVRRGLRA